MSERASRYEELDVLRVIAALAVILLHVAPSQRFLGSREGFYILFKEEFQFAVPAFIAMAAALAWGRPLKGSYTEFMQRRLAAIGVPYVAWVLIYQFVGRQFLVVGHTGTPGILGAVRDFAVDLLTGVGWYHLYFVPIIVGVYLLTPVARALARRSPEALLLASIGVGLIAAFALKQPGYPSPPYALYRGLICIPYAGLGAWYLMRRDAVEPLLRRWWVVLGVVAFGARIWFTGWSDLPWRVKAAVYIGIMLGQVLALLGLADAIRRRTPHALKVAEWANPMTYGVFLSHPFLLWLAAEAFALFGAEMLWQSQAFTLAIYPVAVALSFGFVWLLRINPVSRRLFT